MYHVSTQGVDERMINVHYYYVVCGSPVHLCVCLIYLSECFARYYIISEFRSCVKVEGLTVSVDVKQHWTVLRHWSQFVPDRSTDIRGHEALLFRLMSRQVLYNIYTCLARYYVYVSICFARYIFMCVTRYYAMMRMSSQVYIYAHVSPGIIYISVSSKSDLWGTYVCVLTAQDAHGCKCVRARLYARASFVVRLCMHVFRVIYECVCARTRACVWLRVWVCCGVCVVCFACVCFLYVCVSVCVMCVSVSVCVCVVCMVCVCVCVCAQTVARHHKGQHQHRSVNTQNRLSVYSFNQRRSEQQTSLVLYYVRSAATG